jgi:hypothetical protein
MSTACPVALTAATSPVQQRLPDRCGVQDLSPRRLSHTHTHTTHLAIHLPLVSFLPSTHTHTCTDTSSCRPLPSSFPCCPQVLPLSYIFAPSSSLYDGAAARGRPLPPPVAEAVQQVVQELGLTKLAPFPVDHVAHSSGLVVEGAAGWRLVMSGEGEEGGRQVWRSSVGGIDHGADSAYCGVAWKVRSWVQLLTYCSWPTCPFYVHPHLTYLTHHSPTHTPR